MKIRCILYFFIACFFVLTVGVYISIKACPCALGNSIYFLLENNFYIPKESNVCVFRKIISDTGSGDGWLYGEDDKFYYGMNTEYESDHDPSYYILKKGQESQIFDRFDYKTWDKKKGVKRMTK